MVSYRRTWWVLNPKSHPPSYSYKVRRCHLSYSSMAKQNPTFNTIKMTTTWKIQPSCIPLIQDEQNEINETKDEIHISDKVHFSTSSTTATSIWSSLCPETKAFFIAMVHESLTNSSHSQIVQWVQQMQSQITNDKHVCALSFQSKILEGKALRKYSYYNIIKMRLTFFSLQVTCSNFERNVLKSIENRNWRKAHLP